MSRRSQKRNKFARAKSTALNAALDTIEEDEALGTTRTLSTWQGPNASSSKSMSSVQQALKRNRRRRKAKTSAAPSVRAQVFVVFDALWSGIVPRTKAELTYRLGQLVQAIDNASDEEIQDQFEFIEFVLNRAFLRHQLSLDVATPFMALLRDCPVESLREMSARAAVMMSEYNDAAAPSIIGDGDLFIASTMINGAAASLPDPLLIVEATNRSPSPMSDGSSNDAAASLVIVEATNRSRGN